MISAHRKQQGLVFCDRSLTYSLFIGDAGAADDNTSQGQGIVLPLQWNGRRCNIHASGSVGGLRRRSQHFFTTTRHDHNVWGKSWLCLKVYIGSIFGAVVDMFRGDVTCQDFRRDLIAACKGVQVEEMGLVVIGVVTDSVQVLAISFLQTPIYKKPSIPNCTHLQAAYLAINTR